MKVAQQLQLGFCLCVCSSLLAPLGLLAIDFCLLACRLYCMFSACHTTSTPSVWIISWSWFALWCSCAKCLRQINMQTANPRTYSQRFEIDSDLRKQLLKGSFVRFLPCCTTWISFCVWNASNTTSESVEMVTPLKTPTLQLFRI